MGQVTNTRVKRTKHHSNAFSPLRHHHFQQSCLCVQVGIWRAAIKWVVLWLTLSVLTILNSIALVVILENDVFALICAIMFCWWVLCEPGSQGRHMSHMRMLYGPASCLSPLAAP